MFTFNDWMADFDRFITEDQNQTHLFELSLTKTLGIVSDKSFGIVSGGSPENDQLLLVAIQKAGYTPYVISGEFVYPSKKDDNKEKRVADTTFLVVGTDKSADAALLRKFLFRQADKFEQKSFAYKACTNQKLYAVGVSDDAWPGRHILSTLGTYTPENFVTLISKFKGEHYVFGELHHS